MEYYISLPHCFDSQRRVPREVLYLNLLSPPLIIIEFLWWSSVPPSLEWGRERLKKIRRRRHCLQHQRTRMKHPFPFPQYFWSLLLNCNSPLPLRNPRGQTRDWVWPIQCVGYKAIRIHSLLLCLRFNDDLLASFRHARWIACAWGTLPRGSRPLPAAADAILTILFLYRTWNMTIVKGIPLIAGKRLLTH